MSNPFALLRSHENKAGMILWLLILTLILVPTAGQTRTAAHPAGVSAQRARVMEGYGKLPLAFESNQGQTDSQVKFLSRGAGYSLFLTSTEAVLTLGKASPQQPDSPVAKPLPMKNPPVQPEKPSVLRMELLGASAKVQVTGQDELPGKSNYFIGNDPKNWYANVPQYAKVRYANIYPGVDLVYYGNQRELEYDFVVQPGADPNVIRLGIEGAKDLRLEKGDLVLTSAAGDVHLRRPNIYQQANGTRHEIHGGYVLQNKNEVKFRVASYNRGQALIVDPVLAYSTYLGGNCIYYESEWGNGIAVDVAGNAYVTGSTCASDFPVPNAIQPTNHGNGDAFVTKINADGTTLIYSTYLGGGGGDWAQRIAVDATGNAYITGGTGSPDFPTFKAIQFTNHGRYDAFVTKIDAAGSALVYSTYLGGSDYEEGNSIAVDSSGNAYVVGTTVSSDFPTVKAIQPTHHGGYYDAFVTEINAAGSAFLFSTYLGGSSDEYAGGIALDTARNVYLVGATASTDFPVANAIQPTNHGGWWVANSPCDGFVTKISAGGSALIYSTYLGGSGVDQAGDIAVDAAGNAYVTGHTSSSDFPIANAIQPTNHGSEDAFVTKINADGTALVYSTYLGGSGHDVGSGIAVDVAGNAYMSGRTYLTGFPTINAIQPRNHGGGDEFVTKINADGTALVYSTYLGGSGHEAGGPIAVDSAGDAYVTGSTNSTSFPRTALAFQQSLKGTSDVFVSKIASQTFVSVSPPRIAFGVLVIGKMSTPKPLTVTNQGSGALTVKKIFIGNLNASDFAIQTNNCPPTLSAGGFCNIGVTFTPTAKNKRQAVLGISDSDPASPQAIALSGTGTVVSLFATNLAFGKQAVGTTCAPHNVTLTNVGSTWLNFTDISITGTNTTDYSQTNTCGSSIAAGANCMITVTFKPTALGTRKAAVSISDDGGGSPQKVSLTGTGI